MDTEDIKYEVDSILTPEPDEDGNYPWYMPDERLASIHKLDTSYFRGPYDIKGDGVFERLLDNDSDPLHDTLQSILVPESLLLASFRLFGDSIVEYHERKERWAWYRFYPSILMTAWAAFESWLKINSEILVACSTSIPSLVKDSLLEVRHIADKQGQIEKRTDRRPVLDRYWLLLKYGCNVEFDRGGRIWQAGGNAVKVRDSIVHYNVSQAPALTSSEVWEHLEAIMLLFIAPSTLARRTLFHRQFDAYAILVQLHALLSEFEERPFHKGWPKDAVIFNCPFDHIDDVKYPSRWKV